MPAKSRTTKPKEPVEVQADPEPVAPEVVVKKRVHAPPVSPRSSHFETKDVTDLNSVKKKIPMLKRSIAVYTSIVEGVAKSKSGKFKYSGKEYTKEDVKEMKAALGSSVALLPAASVTASKFKPQVVLSDAEIASRREFRRQRFAEGAQALAQAMSRRLGGSEEYVKYFANALIEKSEAKCKGAVPPKANSSSQIGSCFLISDQFASFLSTSNLGNGIAMLFPNVSAETLAISGASKPEDAYAAVAADIGASPETKIGISKKSLLSLADPRQVISPLLLEERISNPALMMILMSLYVRVNNLRNDEGRIVADKNLRKNFGPGTDTRWVHRGKDYTPTDKADEFAKDGLQRLSERHSEEETLYDGKTFVRRMTIVIANFYRIKTDDAEATAKLASRDTAALVEGVKMFLR